jgi:hypothetical protein
MEELPVVAGSPEEREEEAATLAPPQRVKPVENAVVLVRRALDSHPVWRLRAPLARVSPRRP